jgi:hypothetical protein
VSIINTRRASWQKVSKGKTKKQRNLKRNRHLLSDPLLRSTDRVTGNGERDIACLTHISSFIKQPFPALDECLG